jgi:hypothetical protein
MAFLSLIGRFTIYPYIPKAILALQKAYEHLMLADADN